MQAPIMLLTGHGGEIFCCKFHPDGSALASAGFDRKICKLIWFASENIFGRTEMVFCNLLQTYGMCLVNAKIMPSYLDIPALYSICISRGMEGKLT